jgi:hypothetical protein
MCYARDNVRACKALRRSTIGHYRRPWSCPSNRRPGINWTKLNWTLFHWSLSRISTTSWLQCYRTLSITTVCYGVLWCRASCYCALWCRVHLVIAYIDIEMNACKQFNWTLSIHPRKPQIALGNRCCIWCCPLISLDNQPRMGKSMGEWDESGQPPADRRGARGVHGAGYLYDATK